MKRAIFNVLVAGMMMLISVLGVSAANLDITLTPVQDGSGQVYIEWASQGYEYYDSYAEYFLEEDETKIIEDATKIGYNFSGWVIE